MEIDRDRALALHEHRRLVWLVYAWNLILGTLDLKDASWLAVRAKEKIRGRSQTRLKYFIVIQEHVDGACFWNDRG